MSTRSSVLVSLLAWGVFLALGSTNTQFLSSPVEPPAAKPPQIAAPTTSVGETAISHVHLDPLPILDAARATVETAEWLAYEVRQRKKGDWSSEGTVQRGPNGCCRSETSTRVGSTHGRKIIVCDGRVLARIVQIGDNKPKATPFTFPADRAGQDAMLAENGCGGPAIILAQARATGADWTAQLATVADRPGVALTARIPPTPNDVRGKSPKVLRLYVDAETLWLARAEWWSDAPEQGGVVTYETEFLDPKVNQPLGREECEKVFSYRAES